MKSTVYKYDAFISHAVEDKIRIANEICRRLEQANLRIWYSSEELGPGDKISEKIEQGLYQSRFGIVIFTKTYVAKTYALKEFYQLLNMEKEGKSRILPVLHEITPAELAARGLEMEDRYLISTSRGLDYVIERLVRKIRTHKMEPDPQPTTWKWLTSVLAAMLVSVGIYFGTGVSHDNLDNNIVKAAISERIQDLERKIDKDHELAMTANSGKIVNIQTIRGLFADYQSFKSYFRNNYELDIGHRIIVAKKNVDAALGVDVEEFSPVNFYSMTDPVISLLNDRRDEGGRTIRFSLENTWPVTFNSDIEQINDSICEVSVAYLNNIRRIMVDLSIPAAESGTKRHQMTIYALLPKETYEFHLQKGEWVLREVK